MKVVMISAGEGVNEESRAFLVSNRVNPGQEWSFDNNFTFLVQNKEMFGLEVVDDVFDMMRPNGWDIIPIESTVVDDDTMKTISWG